MKLLAVLSCLCLLLAAAAAQAPKPCKAPPLMSGGFTLMTSAGHITSTGTVSFDSFAERVRLRNYVFFGNETVPVDQLMLFRENVYYEIDWVTRSCEKKRLDASYNPIHVPKDAKLMGQVFMGSSSSFGMGVLTNTWYGDLPNNGQYNSVFTEIGCIPVAFSKYTPEAGWITISTFNWVLGNSNAMDYVPPFFCTKAKLDESQEPVNMFDALESLALRTRRE